MSLRSRLSKLEDGNGGSDRCPSCPLPVVVIAYHQDGRDGEPIATGEPGPCRACGRPAHVIAITEVIVKSADSEAT
jgi:hypothetical protein